MRDSTSSAKFLTPNRREAAFMLAGGFGMSVLNACRSSAAPTIWRQSPMLRAEKGAGTPSATADALQSRLDALGREGGGTLMLGEGEFVIDRPLVVPDRVSVIGAGADRTLLRSAVSDDNWQWAPVLMTGNFASGYVSPIWNHPRASRLAPVSKGDGAAQLLRPAAAGDFVPGDLVLFVSDLYYLGPDGYPIANYLAIRRITATSARLLSVDEPFFSNFKGFAYNMRGNDLVAAAAQRDGRGLPLYVWSEAELAGFAVMTRGHWLNGNSATYKARFSDIMVRQASTIWYGNTFQHSTFDNVSGSFTKKAGELSMNSENTVVQNWTAAFDPMAARRVGHSANAGITMQENGIAVTYRDGKLDVTGFETKASPILGINNFERGTFERLSIMHRGAVYTGNVVEIGTRSVAGRRPATYAVIDVQWSGPCARYLAIAGPETARCKIGGTFRGRPMTGEAFRLSDIQQPNVIAPTAFFEKGRGIISPGVANQEVIGCYVGGGLVPRTPLEAAVQRRNRISAIRSST